MSTRKSPGSVRVTKITVSADNVFIMEPAELEVLAYLLFGDYTIPYDESAGLLTMELRESAFNMGVMLGRAALIHQPEQAMESVKAPGFRGFICERLAEVPGFNDAETDVQNAIVKVVEKTAMLAIRGRW